MAETILFVAIVFGGLGLWFVMQRPRPVRFRRKSVLTGGDLEFFYRLRKALPECVVCPQVSITALIEPAGMGKLRQAALNDIGHKRVGYAVFDEEMQLIAVVELEHRSRRTRKDVAKEAAFASAGIRTVRFHSRRLPSTTKIRSSIYSHAAVPVEPQLLNSVPLNSTQMEYERSKGVWRNTVNAHV